MEHYVTAIKQKKNHVGGLVPAKWEPSSKHEDSLDVYFQEAT